jgi:hypothetical protein
MRFLVEVLHSTLVPHVIEADSEEEALTILCGSEDGEVQSVDPEPQPPIVKRIRVLGE